MNFSAHRVHTNFMGRTFVTGILSSLPLFGDVEKMSKSILVDTTCCIGCGACATGCKIVNNLPLDEPGAAKHLPAGQLSEDALVTFAQGHGEVDGKLSADTVRKAIRDYADL